MKATLLHPGTQHAPQLAKQLFRLGVLRKFITSFAISDEGVSRLVRRLLKGRVISDLPSGVIKSYPVIELMSRMELWMYRNQETVLFRRNSRFQKKVMRNDLEESGTIIGFDTSSWKVAPYCRRTGKRFILDVTIGHSHAKEEIYERLRLDYPLWMQDVPRKSMKLLELEQMELTEAAQIVVPSAFVMRTLVDNGVEREKIRINPFGSSLIAMNSGQRLVRKVITFLFFGALTARKGLPVLLSAWEKMNLKNCQLLLAGYGSIPKGVRLPERVQVLGPIAQSDRLKLYSQADVFVFPSFFEGFAQVLIEAAGSGLPIIATPSSGATEIVQHGYNGLVIQEGNILELADAMSYFASSPSEIEIMSDRIRAAGSEFTWNNYGDRWKKILEG